MNDLLEIQYRRMKRRHEDLLLEEKELQMENDENIKYYVDNRISDPEWQDMLEKAASSLARAIIRRKIAEGKMEDIRRKLRLDY